MELLNPTTLMSFFLGIGLAASAGFRVFIPLFALSLAAHFGGDFLHLNENWMWIGSPAAMITLGIATIVEILAYYLPFIDNILDTVSVPLAAIAGTLLMATTITNMGEVTTWALAIIAGGGTATAVSGTTAALRALSSGSTAGIGNPIINTGETAASSILSITSFIWAPLAFIFVLFILYFVYRIGKKAGKKLSS